MSDLVNYIPILAVISVFIAASMLVYATKRHKGPFSQTATPPVNSMTVNAELPPSLEEPLPTKNGEYTIPPTEAHKAKEDLQILTLEKEIVAYALTRLFEAEAEGTITKDHRLELLDKYKVEMKELEQRISRNETILKLHELEGTQTDLIHTFNNRLNQINQEINSLRRILGLAPQIEPPNQQPERSHAPPVRRHRTQREQPEEPGESAPTPNDSSSTETSAEKAEKDEEDDTEETRGRLRRSTKTETEQKLEAIQEEVLKALERLERIEAES